MALVLTRKIDQAIIMTGTLAKGESISVIVGGVDRDRVKMLIKAPEGIRILREELMQGSEEKYEP